MNERQPYEEQMTQQLNDLPLPDENMAWADMKRRLEEDDDDGIIPIWLRGCGPWAIAAVIILGLGWWFIRADKWGSKNQQAGSEITRQKENTGDSLIINDTLKQPAQPGGEKIASYDTSILRDPGSKNVSSHPGPGSGVSAVMDNVGKQTRENPRRQNNNSVGSKQSKRRSQPAVRVKGNKNPEANDQFDIAMQPGAPGKKDQPGKGETKNQPPVQGKDSVATPTVPAVPVVKTDTTGKMNPTDSAVQKKEPVVKTAEPKKDSSAPKKISFSAGLGMHQLIPVGGQKFTPYNSAGRKGSWGDYIPSLFVRMDKGRWYLQLEFRYGAPQYTKELLYRQEITLDTLGLSNNHIVTNSVRLKKTFYHQLPLTFNYFIKRDWSIGAGIVWNKFMSAVSEEEIRRREINSQVDSLVSDKIFADKGDSVSAFKKSYFQALFETNYRWKRFSIGLRYSFGLQPYIQFKLPGEPATGEKNQSFQVILRYQLWRSKPKK